jgi:hypothetical protein
MYDYELDEHIELMIRDQIDKTCKNKHKILSEEFIATIIDSLNEAYNIEMEYLMDQR